MTKIAVFGAGTWGIALARLLAVHGKDVTVWSAIPAELKALSTTHRHPNLPGMELPAACRLARQYKVEMPIVQAVEAILDGKLEARSALMSLMGRSLKKE